MQTNILLIGIAILVLILAGCTQNGLNLTPGCQLQNCAHATQTPTCGSVPADQQCATISYHEDYCTKYVNCSTENNACTTQIDPKYETCFNCFSACKNIEASDNKLDCYAQCREQFK